MGQVEQLAREAKTVGPRPGFHEDNLQTVTWNDAEDLQKEGDKADDEAGTRTVGDDDMRRSERLCVGLTDSKGWDVCQGTYDLGEGLQRGED